MKQMTLDTNVLVRYLTKDDPVQVQIATDLIENNECEVLHTVLLEVVWVLGSKMTFNMSRSQIVERLRHLFTVPTIYINNPATIIKTLHWYELGMDFADALHLANSDAQFATFDKHLASKAKELNAPQSVLFLGQTSH